MDAIKHKEEHDKNEIISNNFEINIEKLSYAETKRSDWFFNFFCWKINYNLSVSGFFLLLVSFLLKRLLVVLDNQKNGMCS